MTNLEPPKVPSLGTLGIMCGGCYPQAGDRNTLCPACFRKELNVAENHGVEVEFSHTATVQTIFQHVVPRRYHVVKIEHELPETRNLNPLHTGILLAGLSDRGKTYQAAILMLRAIMYAVERGAPIASQFQWHSSAGLLERLRSEQRKTTESRGTVELLTDARMLVLDDLGVEKPSAWVRERVYEIVNRRYESVRPITVTTNLSPEQMSRQLGDRITGRLMEMCEAFEVTGPSRRIAA